MFTCPQCETNIEIDEDTEPDDIIDCPECQQQMVVLSTFPPAVDFA